jgi:hypothetical protein
MSEMPVGYTPSGKPLRLLEAVPNKVYIRLIVRYPHRTDRDYAYFYHEAANRLASTYTGKPDDDTILVPFLMLYRHAFELELKNLIRFLSNIRYRYHESGNSELPREAIDETLRNKNNRAVVVRPALALCALTLAASTFMDPAPAAAVLGVTWLTAAGLAARGPRWMPAGELLDQPVAFRPTGQILLAGLAVTGVLVTVARRSTFDTWSAS